MTTTELDVIDTLVGIDPGSPLDEVRRQRPDTRTYSQVSYDALFSGPAEDGVSTAERLAVATFVAALHGVGLDHYLDLLGAENPTLAPVVIAAADSGRTAGPYGSYPAETVLHDEDTDGLRYVVDPELAAALGVRLAAAFEHVHLLIFRPRESDAAALTALEAAGWTATEIVTLTQLVGFLAFQLRVVTGLRAVQELV